jgi:hypothetical protein
MAGHGYIFHSLYRKYDELAPKAWSDELEDVYRERAQKWRQRALEYAKRLCSPRRKECGQQIFGTHSSCQGVPKHAFSSIEEQAGEVCFLADLFFNEQKLTFPGYEI